MKKYIVSKQTIALFIVCVFMSVASQAQSIKGSSSFIETSVVKPITGEANKTIFQLKLDNKNGEKFTVTVRDNAGTTLFHEAFYDKAFDKKFYFENLNEQGTLAIIVKAVKENASQTFEVNAVTRVVQDVVINRL